MSSTPPTRCSWRQHVIRNGQSFCDCGDLLVARTTTKGALVVTTGLNEATVLMSRDEVERAAPPQRPVPPPPTVPPVRKEEEDVTFVGWPSRWK